MVWFGVNNSILGPIVDAIPPSGASLEWGGLTAVDFPSAPSFSFSLGAIERSFGFSKSFYGRFAPLESYLLPYAPWLGGDYESDLYRAAGVVSGMGNIYDVDRMLLGARRYYPGLFPPPISSLTPYQAAPAFTPQGSPEPTTSSRLAKPGHRQDTDDTALDDQPPPTDTKGQFEVEPVTIPNDKQVRKAIRQQGMTGKGRFLKEKGGENYFYREGDKIYSIQMDSSGKLVLKPLQADFQPT